MKRFLRDNQILLLLIAAALSLLIAIGSWLIPGGTDPLSFVTGFITTPVRNGVNSVLTWAEGVYDNLFRYQDLSGELADLRRQIAGLEDEVRQGREANRENQQLRELLDLQQRRRDFTFESAKVTARGTQGWDSTLTISKGSTSGVSVHDCVITETGVLVGVVSEVGPNWATVDTVISPNLELGGQVSGANATGILEGELSLMQQGLVRLTYLPLNTDAAAGDEVITSGRGEIYPSGLLVGVVQEVKPDPSGMTSYALVQPSVKLDRLIEVFVIKDFDIMD